MKRLTAASLTLLLVSLAIAPARTQKHPKLEDLKREATGEVANLQVFTQQVQRRS